MLKSSPTDSAPTQDRLVAQALPFLFFFSGCFALIYEVLWQRRFGLLFGSTSAAVAGTLAAFFAGLGLGSRILGSRVSRARNPLFVYAILELLIGVGAALVPLILGVFESFYPWLFGHLESSAGLFALVKTLLAFVSLLIPTFCMGGTLPVLGQFVDQSQEGLGLNASWLYAVNTAGAALGTLLVPFILLPQFGSAGALRISILGNLVIAAISWWLARRIPLGSLRKAPSEAKLDSSTVAMANAAPILFFSFVSGLACFALQVLWNRAFAQVHENSIYSFAVIVAIFILALAIGAQIARSSLRRWPVPALLLGFAWIWGSIFLILSPWLFIHFTQQLSYLPSLRGAWSYEASLMALAAGVLFVPITFLGMPLPLLMEQIARRQMGSTGKALGGLLTANIIGSVVGSLLAGFVLPSFFGLWNGLFLIGTMLFVLGAIQFFNLNRNRWASALGGIAAWAILFWCCAQANLPRVKLARESGEHLISIAEGAHGIVAVVERPNSRRLKLNNFYVLGGTSSVGDERMQAHIPLLLHPSPRRVVFLGLGTGITAGGSLFHPVNNITLVEMVPEVIQAARTRFRDANAALLDDSRTSVVLDDARNFLRGSTEKFDVIVGDLVVPWREGEGALFTQEHFAAARARLLPGGLFCVWLPCFQLSEIEIDVLTRTFLSIFPNAYLWRGDFSPTAPAVALIGATEPFRLNPAAIRARIGQLRPDPFNPQLRDPTAFWMQYIGQIGPASIPEKGGEVNREDRPVVELAGPAWRSSHNPTGLLVGRKLQSWCQQFQKSSEPVLGWSATEQNGRAAGNFLAEFTILLSEGREAEAMRVQAQLKGMLPETLFSILFP